MIRILFVIETIEVYLQQSYEQKIVKLLIGYILHDIPWVNTSLSIIQYGDSHTYILISRHRLTHSVRHHRKCKHRNHLNISLLHNPIHINGV